MKGMVIRNTGSWYLVRTDDNELIESKIKGNFRLKGIRSTNPVAIGDRVVIEKNAEGTAFISEIEDRKNYIIRKASNLSKKSHILAANVDQAFLIITLKNPETHLVFIDRFLASAEAYRIPVKIVINKTDQHTQEDCELADAICHLYSTIGYECVQVSALTGLGIEKLKSMLYGKTTLFSGNSGVGKTTLINMLIPGLDLKTASVSASHHKGTHTTTFSEMFEIDGKGQIIDTPGVKGFGTIDFKPEEVAHYFPEIFRVSGNCRFNNCTHRHEPGCAVLEAIENHEISQSRYVSYLSIIDDSTDGKYRKGY